MEEKEKFDIWVTKWALTRGVLKRQAVKTPTLGMVMEANPQSHGHIFYTGADWHLSEEAAVRRAEVMRNSKVKATIASLTRLRSMNFRNVS